MPRRHLPLLACLVLLLPACARAEGINLAWDNCASATGASGDVKFSCDDETRVMVLVGSFLPPGGLDRFIAMEGSLQIVTDANTLPDFWQLGEGGCRSTAGTPQYSFPGMSGCLSPWGAQYVGIWNFSTLDVSAGRGHIRVGAVRPDIHPLALAAGREYYAFRFLLSMEGAPACQGCRDGACIIMNSIQLMQPANEGDALITTAATRNVVTWQGGSSSCRAAGARAARRVTWGQVKSSYR